MSRTRTAALIVAIFLGLVIQTNGGTHGAHEVALRVE